MKMMSFFFGLLLALLHPTLSHTSVEKSSHISVVFQQQFFSIQDKSQGNNHFVHKDWLDITEDETCNSEKKIFSLGKILKKPFSFVEHHFYSSLIKNSSSFGYLFILHTSLFIFLKVFRLWYKFVHYAGRWFPCVERN